ncbi:MAG: chromosomal replication initiator protein DnaA [Candidatus Taylorbacteria bacterium]|nr:chromosomal replication initiator protein DnaA [Candidatus Taylorbacteria bacterium]
MDHTKLWEAVKIEMELDVSKGNLMWLKDSNIHRMEEGVVYLNVPSTFIKEWVWKHFHNTILRILRTHNESVRGLDYVIAEIGGNKKEESIRNIKNTVCSELPLDDFYINKEDNLNPRYTFDSFIIGPFNQIAHAAAQAIIQNPGKVYNPLFIYGNTGLGKTHLIQAVGNYIKKHYPNKKVFYLTSEKFGTDCLECLQTNKMAYFKEKYRKYDAIIVDDIQFFSGKEKFQEELFHLFNHMYDNFKQIIFSSDRHPNYIPNLEDRLKSRFGAGMMVDVPTPDKDSKVAILKAKSRFYNLVLEEEVLNHLAENINSNIRELEGVLNTIVIQTQMKGKHLSLTEIKNLVKDAVKPKKNVSVKEVVKVVAQFYNIEEDNIYDKTRKKEVVKPRQLTMYLLREDFCLSYPSIGEKLGGRDHTTVIHSCEKIKGDLKTDPSLTQELNQIRSML